MEKIVRIGAVEVYQNKWASIYCRIEYKSGKLSISGVIGPTKCGNALGSSGQINMEFLHRKPEHNDERYEDLTKPSDINFAPGWNEKKWLDFLEYWHEWHLNDMQPGCEHQAGWDTGKELELVEYSWTDEFFKVRGEAREGKLSGPEYEQYAKDAADVDQVLFGLNAAKYPFPKVKKLLEKGLIEEQRRETKKAGWVYPEEHPEGVLGKECGVCGYRYGTEWRTKEVPAKVLSFLRRLPDTDKTPAWV